MPDFYRGRKNADFGQGFYLTPDREFAYRWAYEDYPGPSGRDRFLERLCSFSEDLAGS